jgi:hypothetical protein
MLDTYYLKYYAREVPLPNQVRLKRRSLKGARRIRAGQRAELSQIAWTSSDRSCPRPHRIGIRRRPVRIGVARWLGWFRVEPGTRIRATI